MMSQDYSPTRYDCPECKDAGYVIKEWEGAGLASECECQEQKRIQQRMSSAMIPDEFKNATFQDYKITNDTQKNLYNAAVQYVQDFAEIQNSHANSLGFLASFGEQRLKELPPMERRQQKRKYNSFGLGKTHLQVAIAKQLLNQGHKVLIVSDVVLLDELMSQKMNDMDEYKNLMHQVSTVPVLVWDDIGKSSPTEPRKSAYFHIINERYKKQRPIIFSSNEDIETLADRIGDAATSRLLGMSRGRICRVAGSDYRFVGAV